METNQEIQKLRQEIEELKRVVYKGRFSNNFVHDTPVTFRFGFNTAPTSKVGFFNVSPVGQQPAISKPTGGSTADSQSRVAIGLIIDSLKNYGLTL